jgi:hypothetical protein
MTPAIELAQYLADNGVGARGGDAQWGIHVSREPAMPNDVITLYDTGGDPPPAISAELRSRSIQVRVRAVDYAAGMAKQQEIFELLAQPSIEETATTIERDIGTHRYIGVWLTGEIVAIGRDDNDRFLITANYDTHLQPL